MKMKGKAPCGCNRCETHRKAHEQAQATIKDIFYFFSLIAYSLIVGIIFVLGLVALLALCIAKAIPIGSFLILSALVLMIYLVVMSCVNHCLIPTHGK